MRKVRADLRVFDRVADAYRELLQGRVDAVVYDAPSLLYYANGEGQGEVTVVGKVFEPQDYGIALKQGSPRREQINRAILALMESGEIARIRAQWFGHEAGG
jgi:ABC-type amino acid transport substrate-binding protein